MEDKTYKQQQAERRKAKLDRNLNPNTLDIDYAAVPDTRTETTLKWRRPKPTKK